MEGKGYQKGEGARGGPGDRAGEGAGVGGGEEAQEIEACRGAGEAGRSAGEAGRGAAGGKRGGGDIGAAQGAGAGEGASSSGAGRSELKMGLAPVGGGSASGGWCLGTRGTGRHMNSETKRSKHKLGGMNGDVELDNLGTMDDNPQVSKVIRRVNIAKEAMEALKHLRQIQKLVPPSLIRKFEKKIEYKVKVNEELGWRSRIFVLFEDPSHSLLSKCISIIVLSFILLSCVSFIIETLPEYQYPQYGEKQGDSPKIFKTLEYVCLAAFTTEYLIRIGTVNAVPIVCLKQYGYSIPTVKCCGMGQAQRLKVVGWIKSPMNVVDFLSIAPFVIIEAIGVDRNGGTGLQVLRVLRLTRIFRVFKLGKYSEGLHLFAKVITKSLSALYLLFFFMLISTIVFGSMIYYAERGHWDEELGYYTRPDLYGDGKERSPFTSIPHSFWWVIVTATTVGYGDFVPRTELGRMVGTLAMFFGILVIAMPLAIISSNFQLVHEEHMKHKQGYRNTSSGISSRMLELILSLENINNELRKVFSESKALCEKYLHSTTPGVPEARMLNSIDEGNGERNDIHISDLNNIYDEDNQLVIEEFRSLSAQLKSLLMFKRAVILRMKRLSTILVRRAERKRGSTRIIRPMNRGRTSMGGAVHGGMKHI